MCGDSSVTNETYHILGASIRAAKMGIGNGVIILLKKQHKGKTQTVKILQRDNKPYVQKIPAGTEAAIYQFLINTNPSVYYIDDKDKWDRQIYTLGLRYLKGLSDGEKAPLKMTYYTKEQVTNPINSLSWSWLLFNKTQFDSCNPILIETGLYARAVIIRAAHTEKEYLRIQDYYEENGYTENNLPSLKIHDDWYSDAPRKPTKDEKDMIRKAFPEDTQSNVFKLCRAMSEDGFYEIFDCLETSASGNYFDEEIEFVKSKGD